ncbi:MAG: DUF63 family protein [Candidatus Nanohaloarchaea archaeon]
MLTQIKRFLVEKFWRPVANESVYYNPYNTTVYALIFGIAALYLVYPISKKMGITFDRKFFKGIAPFVFLGGAARSLKDINAVNTVLLETPFIFIVLFVFAAISIKVSQAIGRKTDYRYEKVLAAIGSTALAATLSFYSVNNFHALGLFIGLTAGWLIPGYIVLRELRPDLLKPGFVIPVAAHFFDASTSVTSLSFGGNEKHVLAGFAVNMLGPYSMFLVKAAIIVPVVYYINTRMEGEEKNYYLFLIAMLGLAIGTRNLLSTLTLA